MTSSKERTLVRQREVGSLLVGVPHVLSLLGSNKNSIAIPSSKHITTIPASGLAASHPYTRAKCNREPMSNRLHSEVREKASQWLRGGKAYNRSMAFTTERCEKVRTSQHLPTIIKNDYQWLSYSFLAHCRMQLSLIRKLYAKETSHPAWSIPWLKPATRHED